jgi:hypothetical protein
MKNTQDGPIYQMSQEQVLEQLQAYGITVEYIPVAIIKMPGKSNPQKINIYDGLVRITEQRGPLELLTK